ncbi:histone H1 [Chryseobacterium potabilaquae]|uniref:Histone H1-like protein Hc1 n=1 Tax=Chryseobacterium potabilaquae TaxID=2675057 RepID=A0A6N4XDV7_9FLAO|nr:histone H1 [Chryseobacterium potabilaquae]CAA7197624.1 hypothetical protein CHRY9293_03697 [Chryseobacterium potabilaquae]
MPEVLQKINTELEAFKIDPNLQLEKGNNAVVTRARKSALELSKLFKEFRKVSVELSKEK